jgi:disulfide oxidoreductase YuzD
MELELTVWGPIITEEWLEGCTRITRKYPDGSVAVTYIDDEPADSASSEHE